MKQVSASLKKSHLFIGKRGGVSLPKATGTVKSNYESQAACLNHDFIANERIRYLLTREEIS